MYIAAPCYCFFCQRFSK